MLESSIYWLTRATQLLGNFIGDSQGSREEDVPPAMPPAVSPAPPARAASPAAPAAAAPDDDEHQVQQAIAPRQGEQDLDSMSEEKLEELAERWPAAAQQPTPQLIALLGEKRELAARLQRSGRSDKFQGAIVIIDALRACLKLRRRRQAGSRFMQLSMVSPAMVGVMVTVGVGFGFWLSCGSIV